MDLFSQLKSHFLFATVDDINCVKLGASTSTENYMTSSTKESTRMAPIESNYPNNLEESDVINLKDIFEAPFRNEDEDDDGSLAEVQKMFSGPIKPSRKKTAVTVKSSKSSASAAAGNASIATTSKSAQFTTGAKITLQNDFDPFRRLPNVPFSVNGRPRSLSLHSRPNGFPFRRNSLSFISKLEPIIEEEMDFGDEIEEIFK